jgi:guanidinobutyrase
MSIVDHKTRGMTMLRPTRMAAFGVLVAVVALASSACARTEASEQAAVPTPATSQPSDRQVAQGQPPAPGAPAAAENRATVYYTQRPEDPEVHLNGAFDLAEFARPRDMSKDPKREPGPINVQRNRPSNYQGIPTFFRAPVALTPEDLKAGKVDVAFLGASIDMGYGLRGAAWGPRALRAYDRRPGGVGDGPPGSTGAPNMHAMLDPFRVLNVADYGDAPIDPLSIERSMAPVRANVREIAATGTIPFIIGGDHSLEYADVAGLADVHGKGQISVIHFDSHFDASGAGDHFITHGQPVRRVVDEGHVLGRNYIQVGLRGYYPDEEGFRWMRQQGMRYHTMAEVERDGWNAVMKRVMAEALDGPEKLHISFDIDVIDPTYAPGTGTPEPGGPTPREMFPVIRNLCAQKNVVGMDLVEVNPLVDPGYTTALVANRIVKECLTGLALRKKGITESNYLSPLVVDWRP